MADILRNMTPEALIRSADAAVRDAEVIARGDEERYIVGPSGQQYDLLRTTLAEARMRLVVAEKKLDQQILTDT